MEYPQLEKLAAQLKALAHPVRLDMVMVLGELGEVKAGDLGHEVEVSQPEVSRHLAVLEQAGVVIKRSKSRYKYYRLTDQTLAKKLPQLFS